MAKRYDNLTGEWVDDISTSTGTGTGIDTDVGMALPPETYSDDVFTAGGTETGVTTGVSGQMPTENSGLDVPPQYRDIALTLGLSALATPAAAGARALAAPVLKRYAPRALSKAGSALGGIEKLRQMGSNIPLIGGLFKTLPDVTQKAGQIRAATAAGIPAMNVARGNENVAGGVTDVVAGMVSSPSLVKEALTAASVAAMGSIFSGRDPKTAATSEIFGSALGRGAEKLAKAANKPNVFETKTQEILDMPRAPFEPPDDYLQTINKRIGEEMQRATTLDTEAFFAKQRGDYTGRGIQKGRISVSQDDQKFLAGINKKLDEEAAKEMFLNNIKQNPEYAGLNDTQLREVANEILTTRARQKAEQIGGTPDEIEENFIRIKDNAFNIDFQTKGKVSLPGSVKDVYLDPAFDIDKATNEQLFESAKNARNQIRSKLEEIKKPLNEALNNVRGLEVTVPSMPTLRNKEDIKNVLLRTGFVSSPQKAEALLGIQPKPGKPGEPATLPEVVYTEDLINLKDLLDNIESPLYRSMNQIKPKTAGEDLRLYRRFIEQALENNSKQSEDIKNYIDLEKTTNKEYRDFLNVYGRSRDTLDKLLQESEVTGMIDKTRIGETLKELRKAAPNVMPGEVFKSLPEQQVREVFINSMEGGFLNPEAARTKLDKLLENNVISKKLHTKTVERLEPYNNKYKLFVSVEKNPEEIVTALLDNNKQDTAISVLNDIYRINKRPDGNLKPEALKAIDGILSKTVERVVSNAVTPRNGYNIVDIEKVLQPLQKLKTKNAEFFYQGRQDAFGPIRDSNPVDFAMDFFKTNQRIRDKDVRVLSGIIKGLEGKGADPAQIFQNINFPSNVQDAILLKNTLLAVPEGDKVVKNIQNALVNKHLIDSWDRGKIADTAGDKDLMAGREAVLEFLDGETKVVADKIFNVADSLRTLVQSETGKDLSFQQVISNVARAEGVGKAVIPGAARTLAGALALLRFVPTETLRWLSSKGNFDMFVNQWVRELTRAGYLSTKEGKIK